MLKLIVGLIVALYAALCFAEVEVNKASAAELDSIRGIGPSLSDRILDERNKGAFQDWNDLIARVKGMGPRSAVKFSAEGLTVNDMHYKETAAAPLAKETGK